LGGFIEQAQTLVNEVGSISGGFSQEQMAANARGPHWFSIMGYDRNNKKVSY
jgi:hypothetical protein